MRPLVPHRRGTAGGVTLLAGLSQQLGQADGRLRAVAQADPVVGQRCTAPGIGPVTAVTVVATLVEVGRFEAAKRVQGYLGLVPSERSSSHVSRINSPQV